MRMALSKIVYKVGHRGTFLLALALFDFLFGYSIFSQPGPAQGLDFIFPLHFWGVAWVVCGALILTGVPVRRDYFAFTVATAIKIVWSVLYIHAWVFETYPRGWVSALIWLLFALLVVIISSWPEVRSFKIPIDYTPPDGIPAVTDKKVPKEKVDDE